MLHRQKLGGDFLASTVEGIATDYSVEFSDSDNDQTYTGQISVPLDVDTIGEPTSDIKLALNTKPTVYRLGTVSEGIITILDDDAPELKISAGTTLTESDNLTADFKISAEVSPNKIITVRYDLAETSDFIEDEATGKNESLDFSNQTKEVTLSIPIVSDTEVESNGTITVTLIADNANPIAYTVGAAPNNSAVVNVVDDDSLPLIEILADSGNVGENVGPANFKLTATGLTVDTTLEINATPAEDGSDFLTDAVASTTSDFSVGLVMLTAIALTKVSYQ